MEGRAIGGADKTLVRRYTQINRSPIHLPSAASEIFHPVRAVFFLLRARIAALRNQRFTILRMLS